MKYIIKHKAKDIFYLSGLMGFYSVPRKYADKFAKKKAEKIAKKFNKGRVKYIVEEV